jgi:predicted nucleic acid-binding Zn ribbon protein
MAETPDMCPVCGTEVPERARACPECGADEKTGWSERARYDDLGIPDDSFDYEDFVEREFEGKKSKRKLTWLWFLIALLLVLAFVLPFLRH